MKHPVAGIDQTCTGIRLGLQNWLKRDAVFPGNPTHGAIVHGNPAGTQAPTRGDALALTAVPSTVEAVNALNNICWSPITESLHGAEGQDDLRRMMLLACMPQPLQDMYISSQNVQTASAGVDVHSVVRRQRCATHGEDDERVRTRTAMAQASCTSTRPGEERQNRDHMLARLGAASTGKGGLRRRPELRRPRSLRPESGLHQPHDMGAARLIEKSERSGT